MKDTTFKEEFNVEQYYCMILSPLRRAAFCKFRCGVAPIRIETGRYEHLSVDESALFVIMLRMKVMFCLTAIYTRI